MKVNKKQENQVKLILAFEISSYISMCFICRFSPSLSPYFVYPFLCNSIGVCCSVSFAIKLFLEYFCFIFHLLLIARGDSS